MVDDINNNYDHLPWGEANKAYLNDIAYCLGIFCSNGHELADAIERELARLGRDLRRAESRRIVLGHAGLDAGFLVRVWKRLAKTADWSTARFFCALAGIPFDPDGSKRPPREKISSSMVGKIAKALKVLQARKLVQTGGIKLHHDGQPTDEEWQKALKCGEKRTRRENQSEQVEQTLDDISNAELTKANIRAFLSLFIPKRVRKALCAPLHEVGCVSVCHGLEADDTLYHDAALSHLFALLFTGDVDGVGPTPALLSATNLPLPHPDSFCVLLRDDQFLLVPIALFLAVLADKRARMIATSGSGTRPAVMAALRHSDIEECRKVGQDEPLTTLRPLARRAYSVLLACGAFAGLDGGLAGVGLRHADLGDGVLDLDRLFPGDSPLNVSRRHGLKQLNGVVRKSNGVCHHDPTHNRPLAGDDRAARLLERFRQKQGDRPLQLGNFSMVDPSDHSEAKRQRSKQRRSARARCRPPRCGGSRQAMGLCTHPSQAHPPHPSCVPVTNDLLDFALRHRSLWQSKLRMRALDLTRSEILLLPALAVAADRLARRSAEQGRGAGRDHSRDTASSRVEVHSGRHRDCRCDFDANGGCCPVAECSRSWCPPLSADPPALVRPRNQLAALSEAADADGRPPTRTQRIAKKRIMARMAHAAAPAAEQAVDLMRQYEHVYGEICDSPVAPLSYRRPAPFLPHEVVAEHPIAAILAHALVLLLGLILAHFSGLSPLLAVPFAFCIALPYLCHVFRPKPSPLPPTARQQRFVHRRLQRLHDLAVALGRLALLPEDGRYMMPTSMRIGLPLQKLRVIIEGTSTIIKPHPDDQIKQGFDALMPQAYDLLAEIRAFLLPLPALVSLADMQDALPPLATEPLEQPAAGAGLVERLHLLLGQTRKAMAKLWFWLGLGRARLALSDPVAVAIEARAAVVAYVLDARRALIEAVCLPLQQLAQDIADGATPNQINIDYFAANALDDGNSDNGSLFRQHFKAYTDSNPRDLSFTDLKQCVLLAISGSLRTNIHVSGLRGLERELSLLIKAISSTIALQVPGLEHLLQPHERPDVFMSDELVKAVQHLLAPVDLAEVGQAAEGVEGGAEAGAEAEWAADADRAALHVRVRDLLTARIAGRIRKLELNVRRRFAAPVAVGEPVLVPSTQDLLDRLGADVAQTHLLDFSVRLTDALNLERNVLDIAAFEFTDLFGMANVEITDWASLLAEAANGLRSPAAAVGVGLLRRNTLFHRQDQQQYDPGALPRVAPNETNARFVSVWRPSAKMPKERAIWALSAPGRGPDKPVRGSVLRALRASVGLTHDVDESDDCNPFFNAEGDVHVPRKVPGRSMLRDCGQLASPNGRLLADLGFDAAGPRPSLHQVLQLLHEGQASINSPLPKGKVLSIQFESLFQRLRVQPALNLIIAADINSSSGIVTLCGRDPKGNILRSTVRSRSVEEGTRIKHLRHKSQHQRALARRAGTPQVAQRHLDQAVRLERQQRGAYRRLAFLVHRQVVVMIKKARALCRDDSLHAILAIGSDYSGFARKRPAARGGSIQTPTRLILDTLRQYHLVVQVAEHATSSRCPKCCGSLEHFVPAAKEGERRRRRTGRLKICRDCGGNGRDRVLHRDHAAAQQLLNIVLAYGALGFRPRHLCANPEHRSGLEALRALPAGQAPTAEMLRRCWPYLADWYCERLIAGWHGEASIVAAREHIKPDF